MTVSQARVIVLWSHPRSSVASPQLQRPLAAAAAAVASLARAGTP